MKMTIDMPPVTACSVSACAYNVDERCHARAITVGDGAHPGCDTFLGALKHTHQTEHDAGVGACKVTGCAHNRDFECMADAISVGHAGKRVSCLAFESR